MIECLADQVVMCLRIVPPAFTKGLRRERSFSNRACSPRLVSMRTTIGRSVLVITAALVACNPDSADPSRIPSPPPAGEASSTPADVRASDETRARSDEATARTRRELQTIATYVELYRMSWHGRCPSEWSELKDTGIVPDANPVRDPWGQPYRLGCAERNGQATITSSGPDQRLGTADDLEMRASEMRPYSESDTDRALVRPACQHAEKASGKRMSQDQMDICLNQYMDEIASIGHDGWQRRLTCIIESTIDSRRCQGVGLPGIKDGEVARLCARFAIDENEARACVDSLGRLIEREGSRHFRSLSKCLFAASSEDERDRCIKALPPKLAVGYGMGLPMDTE